MVKLLEWLSRILPMQFSKSRTFGSFKFGGKRYER